MRRTSTRAWLFTAGGIVAGFGFLFFTIWRDALPDATSLAAALFAFSAALFATADRFGRGSTHCLGRDDTPIV